MVGDDEILDAKAAIDRSGIGCEPASAASLAGLRHLVRDGIVGSDETAVALLTGHILKTPTRSPTSTTSTALHATERTGRSASRPSFPRWSRLLPMCFTVRTPASSANLGPGFDALGLALGLWNEATIDPSGEPGWSPCAAPRPVCSMAARTWRNANGETGRALPPFSLVVHTDVPVARGLGSSAAAIVAGLVAANHLATSLPVPTSIHLPGRWKDTATTWVRLSMAARYWPFPRWQTGATPYPRPARSLRVVFILR